MSLRGPGLAALSRHTTSTAAYNHLSSQLTAQQLTDLRSQLDTFSAALRQFASAHRNDILRDPQFRGEFQRMCANIGVDPLGAAKVSGSGSRIEGLWNDLLGLGDFNYELGVQVVDVCISTRALNGGVIEMDALIRRLQQMRGGGGGSSDDASASTAISEEDVVRAIKSLEPLGSGYQVVSTSTAPGAPKLVHSLPGELSLDSTLLLSRLALPTCPRVGPFAYLTEEDVARAHKWTRQRARNALQRMCNDEGTLWVDVDGGDVRYFSLSSV